MRPARSAVLSLAALLLLGSAALAEPKAKAKKAGGPPPPPPVRKIPGLTAPDTHPNACVDCHKDYPEMNMDVRLSTLLAKWAEKVEPRMLARAQTAAGEFKLTGKHPKSTAALAGVPQKCLTCHGKASKKAPPFARLMHALHLVGGKDNHFMTYYQGDCTYCHKLDQKTGEWKVPSGPSK